MKDLDNLTRSSTWVLAGWLLVGCHRHRYHSPPCWSPENFFKSFCFSVAFSGKSGHCDECKLVSSCKTCKQLLNIKTNEY